MVEHDKHVGQVLKVLDDLNIADDTFVLYSTDNGPHLNSWPDAAITPFRSEKNSNWEGAYRVSCVVRWPGHFHAGTTLNGIVAHEDWLPTFAAAAGAPDIKEKLLKGVELSGRTYKNYVDGYNMLDYLSGKTEGVAAQGVLLRERRRRDRRGSLPGLEGRVPGKPRCSVRVWREPFVQLRVPLLFNLRRDPFEQAQHNSNTYYDWLLERLCVLIPLTEMAGKFLLTFKDYPPAQTAGSFNLTKMQKQIEELPKAH